jgi:pimeloyl-ACP methyl ester carboxylesterase
VAEEMAAIGDVELCYETFGDPSDPAMLLIMGLATQMIGWHDDFCAELAGRGFHVIRFDNRDIGRSTKLSHVPPPTTWQIVRRDARAAGYTLEDMADDAVGLLDHLGIERAHVAGASMGGMIAQTVAIRHPERVLSLVSIMSNTGARWSGLPALSILPMFLKRAPRDREGFAAHTVSVFEAIGSPDYPPDGAEIRERAYRAHERGIDPAGSARQLAAILAAHDRTRELRGLRVPTLVIHGKADKMLLPSGGRNTAKVVPGARLELIEGMGHDLPRALWPRILDAIEENAARAATSAGSAAPR